MKLSFRSREEVRQAWADRPMMPESRPLNVRNVAHVGGWELLEFGDTHYLVPPISFEDGAQLLDMLVHIREFSSTQHPTREQVIELRGRLHEAVALMGSLIRPLRFRARFPAGLLCRLAWRFTRNPFRNATAQEVGALLGFFSTRQTTPRVRGVG